MRRRNYYPPAFDQLEGRVVLTHSVNRGLSVVVSGLSPQEQVLNHRQQPVIAEVNQAFDSFTSDYDQARATYFASLQNQSNAGASTAAFSTYTVQRIALLEQQLISSFLQMPQGTARASKRPALLELVIRQKIIGPPGKPMVAGSLAKSLTDTIPPAGSGGATAALYTMSQDNAIAAARDAIINAVNIAKNQDFGNKSNSHH